jgi:hypothetical protein
MPETARDTQANPGAVGQAQERATARRQPSVEAARMLIYARSLIGQGRLIPCWALCVLSALFGAIALGAWLVLARGGPL